ncbi:MAG: hypothetical protein QF535_10085, partial [Anaerolineales bacterium]|nr:hypothetical protein [Anaerolineales bacterium]
MSEVKTNKLTAATGTAITLGDSGDTFTVPSGATLAVASGGTITNSGTASGFGGGKVLQVITATDTTASSVTSGSFTNTALTASITCAATTSKVLVWATAPLTAKRNDNWLYNPV